MTSLSVGDEVTIDLPISQRLHGKRGVIHSRYHDTSAGTLESWWVVVEGYEPDQPCWFRAGELKKTVDA